MMRFPLTFALIILLLLPFGVAATLSSCSTITSSGVYTLTANLNGVATGSSACINITVPDVTIDCAGFSITNDGTSGAVGIYSNGTNTSVINCAIEHYDKGIYVAGSSSSLLQSDVRNNNLFNFTSYGIWLEYSNNSIIFNNTVDEANIDGIRATYPLNLTIANNTVINSSNTSVSSASIHVGINDANTRSLIRVENNTIIDAISRGIWVQPSPSYPYLSPVVYNNNVTASSVVLSSAPYAISYASDLNFSFNNFERHVSGGTNYAPLTSLSGTTYVVNNTFNNLSNGGIDLSGSGIAYVYNNTMANGGGSGGIGAAFRTSFETIFEDNVMENLSSRGISIIGSSVRVEVRRNTFKSITYSAAFSGYCSSNSIFEFNNFTSLSVNAIYFTSGSNTAPCIIRNNTIDGANVGMSFFMSSNDVIVENNTLTNVQQGISSTNTNSKFATIRYNTISSTTSSTGYAIRYRGNGVIESNTISNTAGGGIYADGATTKQVNVSHNYLYNITRDGIVLYTNNGALAYNNTINASITGSYRGMSVYISNGANVSNNKIIDMQGTSARGVYLYYSDDVLFESNSITALDGTYGIFITNSNNTTIRDFNISGPLTYGIYLTTNANNSLVDGFVVDGSATGVYLTQNYYNKLKNGIINKSTADGIYLTPNGNSTIHNVTIIVSSGDGIEIQMDNQTINSSTISGATGVGILVKGASNGNNIVLSNTKLYNNSVDISIDKLNVYVGNNYNFTNITLDNPKGNGTNSTRLDFVDSLVNKTRINISWAARPAALPPATSDALGSYINITSEPASGGSTDIDALKLYWDDASLGSVDESKLALYKYNGAWQVLNNTPNTTENSLSAYNIASLSTFAILENTTDITPPSIDFVAPTPSNASNVSGIVVINVTASDPNLDTIQLFLNGTLVKTCSASPCTYNWDTTSYADDYYMFNATANDSYGNENSTQRFFYTDNTPPNISREAPTPTNNSFVAGSIELNFSATDPHFESISIYISNTKVATCSASPCTYNWDTTSYADGDVWVNVSSNDSLGNNARKDYNYSVDNTKPTISFVAPTPANGSYTTAQTINVTASDANLKNITLLVGGSPVLTCNTSPCNYTLSSPGTYIVGAVAYDLAGNLNQTDNLSITISSPSTGGDEAPSKSLSISYDVLCPEQELSVNVGSGGREVSDVRVVVKLKDGSFIEAQYTDGEGNALFNIPQEGKYVITASKSGYTKKSMEVSLAACEEPKEAGEQMQGPQQNETTETPPLKVGGELPTLVIRVPTNVFVGEDASVFAYYLNGSPAAGISLGIDGPEDSFSLTTDSEGEASFTPEQEGLYSIDSEYPLTGTLAFIVKKKAPEVEEGANKTLEEGEGKEATLEVPLVIEENAPVIITPDVKGPYKVEVYAGDSLVSEFDADAGQSIRVELPKGNYTLVIKSSTAIEKVDVEVGSYLAITQELPIRVLAIALLALLLLLLLLLFRKKKRSPEPHQTTHL